MKESCLLIDTLRDPTSTCRYSPTDWDLLVRQARSANLLAQLGVHLEQHLALEKIPNNVLRHSRSTQLIVKRLNKAIHWEMSFLRYALYDLSVPIVALKGAAYTLAGLPNSNSRLFHDIDILVPRHALEEVESSLERWGWKTTHNNAYDQRYYRQWMHELPPLEHLQRQTVLDVHHSILPLTSRIHPDPKKLISNALADPNNEDIYWLSPEDMVLHSMTHLFHDGELENGLRDLLDIKLLLKQFGEEDGFWVRLSERAAVLELTRPLYYGLRYTERVFQTRVPEAIRKAVASWGPGLLFEKLMDFLFLKALQPDHASCSTVSTSIARWLLYLRAQYLRMPLRLLIPHLIRKAVVKDSDEDMSTELKKVFGDDR